MAGPGLEASEVENVIKSVCTKYASRKTGAEGQRVRSCGDQPEHIQGGIPCSACAAGVTAYNAKLDAQRIAAVRRDLLIF